MRELPVIGIVSRLAWQKGFDLCFDVLPRVLCRRGVQLVVLGTGEPKYEALFSGLARRFPRQVRYLSAFSEPVAHLIEAGADMFLMPSRYEPCGLNQMYSLRYGTVPIVHRTGGLADTVFPFDAARGTGNGFAFDHFDEGGLSFALGAALRVWGRPACLRPSSVPRRPSRRACPSRRPHRHRRPGRRRSTYSRAQSGRGPWCRRPRRRLP